MNTLRSTSAIHTVPGRNVGCGGGAELFRFRMRTNDVPLRLWRQASGTGRATRTASYNCDDLRREIQMGRLRTMSAVACATVLLGTAGAAAQPADRTTFVTFSGPISVPGTTLPAGTYTFRLAESPADRHIVQIFDRDQSKLYATLLAVPAERNEPGGEPVITFKETPATMAPALRYWYYAGEKAGNEFVYPKTQAMTIARASGEGVMSADTDASDMTD